MTHINRTVRTGVLAVLAGVSLLALYVVPGYLTPGAEAQSAPRYIFDPTWPKPLPNKWKLGGITGLAVDKDDNVWVLNRPNDLTDQENRAEPNPPVADCCRKPPTMIHFDKDGKVIGSFEAPQGHGMDVDSQGFVYIGSDTVRKYDSKTGQMVKELPSVLEDQPGTGAGGRGTAAPGGRGRGAAPAGGRGAAGGRGGRAGGGGADPELAATLAEFEKAKAAFRAKYPPDTPMIIGGLEEIRLDEAAREIYTADNYLQGRILVWNMDTFAFKRGWGAYGKPLKEISTNDADHAYAANGPMPKDFAGHLTLNFSSDGLVYAADRNANRIHVTDKQGKYMNKEFVLAPSTGAGGSTGGVGMSTDKEQRYLIISDLTNNKVWFLNRQDGKLVGQFGMMGENGGLFHGLHMIAVDSQGNIYTGEVLNGERVQRFVPADSAQGKKLAQGGLQPMN